VTWRRSRWSANRRTCTLSRPFSAALAIRSARRGRRRGIGSRVVSSPTGEQQALFGALAGRQAEIDRFLGVLTGAVPLADFQSPRNLLRLLGPRAMARLALGRLRRPRQGTAAAHPAVAEP
jgi:hypothetical protein